MQETRAVEKNEPCGKPKNKVKLRIIWSSMQIILRAMFFWLICGVIAFNSCAPTYKRWTDDKKAVARSIKEDSIQRAKQRNDWLTTCPNEHINFAFVNGLDDTLKAFLRGRLLETAETAAKIQKRNDSLSHANNANNLQEAKGAVSKRQVNNSHKIFSKPAYYIDSCSLSHFDSATINNVKQLVLSNPGILSIRSRKQIDGVDSVFGYALFVGFDNHFFKDTFPNISFTELFYGQGRYISGTIELYVLRMNSDSTFNIVKGQFGGYLD